MYKYNCKMDSILFAAKYIVFNITCSIVFSVSWVFVSGCIMHYLSSQCTNMDSFLMRDNMPYFLHDHYNDFCWEYCTMPFWMHLYLYYFMVIPIFIVTNYLLMGMSMLDSFRSCCIAITVYAILF